MKKIVLLFASFVMLFCLSSCSFGNLYYANLEGGAKGIEVYCEKMNDNYECRACEGTNRNKTYEELKTIQEDYPCPLSTMKTILSYPDDARNSIYIRIIDYPLSIDNFVGEIPDDETLLFLKNELGLN